MAQYKLTDTIDPNKLFLINRSELDDRFDPIYYKMKDSFIKNFKFPLDKLGNSFIIKDGDHDKLPEIAISDSMNGRRYLRSQDLKANTIIDENPIFVSEEYFQCVKRCHIFPGDLLFSIMASLGATAIVPDNYPICTANRAVGILRSKNNNKLSPEFVQAIFNTNIGMSLLELEKRGAIQQRLNLSDLAGIKLPTPNYNIQKEIIQIYKYGIAQKQQKESEAKALLESIDSYLLGELVIELPEQDNTLKNRIFTISVRELMGGRFDPKYNNKFYQDFEKQISKYKAVSSYIKVRTGDPFPSEDFGNGNIPLIRIREIRRGELFVDNGILLDEKYYEKYPNSIPQDNELLIGMDGDEYRCVKYEKDIHGKILINQRVAIINCNEELINADYLEFVINSMIVINQFDRNRSVAGTIGHISSRDIRGLRIPIPPIDKQIEIANHIQDISSRAKALQHEAAQVLEAAKQEVERMILGE